MCQFRCPRLCDQPHSVSDLRVEVGLKTFEAPCFAGLHRSGATRTAVLAKFRLRWWAWRNSIPACAKPRDLPPTQPPPARRLRQREGAPATKICRTSLAHTRRVGDRASKLRTSVVQRGLQQLLQLGSLWYGISCGVDNTSATQLDEGYPGSPGNQPGKTRGKIIGARSPNLAGGCRNPSLLDFHVILQPLGEQRSK